MRKHDVDVHVYNVFVINRFTCDCLTCGFWASGTSYHLPEAHYAYSDMQVLDQTQLRRL